MRDVAAATIVAALGAVALAAAAFLSQIIRTKTRHDSIDQQHR